MWQIILPILLFLTSVFLILLVLIQRGRGGGLAGAFGGMGGQSAFGTKAGDLFTRVTIGTATVWIILCAASVKLLNTSGTELISSDLGGESTNVAPSEPVSTPESGAPAGKAPETDASSAAPADSAPAESPAAAPAGEAAAPAGGPAAEPSPTKE